MFRHPLLRLTVALAVLFGALSATGCRKKAPSAGNTGTVGDITVKLDTDPSPAHVGHDTILRFTLTNAQGPVSGANIRVDTRYLNMHKDGPTDLTATERGAGVYEAPDVSTGMAGRWEATATITPPGGSPGEVTLGFKVAK